MKKDTSSIARYPADRGRNIAQTIPICQYTRIGYGSPLRGRAQSPSRPCLARDLPLEPTQSAQNRLSSSHSVLVASILPFGAEHVMDTPNRFLNNRRAKSVPATLVRSRLHAYHGADSRSPWACNGIWLAGWVGAQGIDVYSANGRFGSARQRRSLRTAPRRVLPTSRIDRPHRPGDQSDPGLGRLAVSFGWWRSSTKRVDTKSFYLSPARRPPARRSFRPANTSHSASIRPTANAPIVRCYSLSDYPHDDFYRCTIKLVRPPHDRPDLPLGRGSNYFHRHVHVGDTRRSASTRPARSCSTPRPPSRSS